MASTTRNLVMLSGTVSGFLLEVEGAQFTLCMSEPFKDRAGSLRQRVMNFPVAIKHELIDAVIAMKLYNEDQVVVEGRLHTRMKAGRNGKEFVTWVLASKIDKF